jgi:hypothetical protein
VEHFHDPGNDLEFSRRQLQPHIKTRNQLRANVLPRLGMQVLVRIRHHLPVSFSCCHQGRGGLPFLGRGTKVGPRRSGGGWRRRCSERGVSRLSRCLSRTWWSLGRSSMATEVGVVSCQGSAQFSRGVLFSAVRRLVAISRSRRVKGRLDTFYAYTWIIRTWVRLNSCKKHLTRGKGLKDEGNRGM